jgi:hypothetical protein
MLEERPFGRVSKDETIPGASCAKHPHSRDADGARAIAQAPPRIRGAGNAGCAVRTHSLAYKMKEHTSKVTTGPPQTTGIPCAMVLTVSFELSSVTGLCCHHRLRDTSRTLDASVGASGPHDFAVRARLSQKPLDGPGTSSAEALAKTDQRRSSCARRRVHRIPRPTSVTIAIRLS